MTSSAPSPAVTEEQIPLADIDTDDETFGTRVDLNLDALADSLKNDGQMVAVHLRQRADGKYQIVAGFRRCNAAKLLEWQTIRAVVATDDDTTCWRRAWQENMARRSMTATDRWFTVGKLLQAGHSQREVANLLGVNESTVSRDAAWLRLPQSVRGLVGQHGFTVNHAVSLMVALKRQPLRNIDKLLVAYQLKPCPAEVFAVRVRQYFAVAGGRSKTGVKFKGTTVTLNEDKLDFDELGEVGIGNLETRLRRVLGKIERWRALTASGESAPQQQSLADKVGPMPTVEVHHSAVPNNA